MEAPTHKQIWKCMAKQAYHLRGNAHISDRPGQSETAGLARFTV
jgi:hypothetical protein